MLKSQATVKRAGHKGARRLVTAVLCLSFMSGSGVFAAEQKKRGSTGGAITISAAMARAYGSNPTLNAQRAATRAVDETVPQARALGRPKINATADAGYAANTSRGRGTFGRQVTSFNDFPRGIGLTVDQTLFNGFRTENSISAAESQVLGQRETLRNSEQNVLLSAATAYMNVLRDTAILNLRRNNVEVLEEQLRQTRDRFKVGEVTRTDVAQAEASLQTARADASGAESNLKTSIATYRQQIGAEPTTLAAAAPVDRLLPPTLEAAVRMSQVEHPAIVAALHGVDTQLLQVKVSEADLYPTLGVRGSLSRRWESSTPNSESVSASVVGTLSIPIYEGGQFYSRTRQAKETLGQRRFDVDTSRDTVRQAVVSAWGGLQTAKAQIRSGREGVKAAEIALSGVREEAKVGQRTTLDVLNSQQLLLNARVALIGYQRDEVVASYTVLSAIGRLSARTLALEAAQYDPKVHYEQVKDKWFGLRTPDGL